MSFRLLLPAQIHREMLAQAQLEYPNECCGLLAGRIVKIGQAQVDKCYPLVNAAASPVLFESEPEGMFTAERDRRQRGLEILAVYHSHPTSAPVPSKTDLERNYSPEVMNLIISLLTDPPEVRAWWLTAEGYREAEWEVVE